MEWHRFRLSEVTAGSALFAAPTRLLALFVLLTAAPLIAIGWLGWRVLEQDGVLEAQRLRERLDSAADLVARELDRNLTTWDAVAAGGASQSPPPTTLVLLVDSNGVLTHRGVQPPYYPHVPHPAGSPAGLFDSGEAQEFREQNLSKAAETYRRLATSRDRSVRAAALLRLARVFRKQQLPRPALAVYNELATLGDTPVAGSPSELVAHHERTILLKTLGDARAAASESDELTAILAEGRFVLDRSTFEFFADGLPHPPAPTSRTAPDSMEFSEALDRMWPEIARGARGRATWTGPRRTFVAIWQPTQGGTGIVVGPVDQLMAPLAALLNSLGVRLHVRDENSRQVWGSSQDAPAPSMTRVVPESGLPWSMSVALADPGAAQAASSSRRRLVFSWFGLMALVIAAAGYVVFRSVNRELAVARLQSDFVAAVSHEFRTPLTAMCHLTEMLEEGRTPVNRLPDYYRALGHESRRLHTMVESLLDFGRLESGRQIYEFAEYDADDLVGSVVADFRERGVSGHRVAVSSDEQGAPHRIRGDRETLAMALRNVIDNAIKYSPQSSTIRIGIARSGRHVRLSVADEGDGISKDERQQIFKKFSRGAAARTLNVKGTGIGLAMTAQIVKAHGGRLELESEPGCGSTFTIVLPVQEIGSAEPTSRTV